MIVPIAGGLGVRGLAFITTFPVGIEIHPEVLVTVKVYVPASSPVTVVLAPVPSVVRPSEYLVTIHMLVAGSPLSTTLPVPTSHVGWIMVPMTGVAGVGGWALIVTLADAADVQFAAVVTVKLYIPGIRPEIVVLVPVPGVVVPPGLVVSVQVPDDGRFVS